MADLTTPLQNVAGPTIKHLPQDHLYGNEWCKANCGEDPRYPGWQASNYQTPEEWQGKNLTDQQREALVTELRARELHLTDLPADGEYRFTDKVEHYNQHPSGVECQEIIRECKDPMVAFAMKHLWRSQWGNKPGAPKTLDLKKAIEYLQLELAREEGQARL